MGENRTATQRNEEKALSKNPQKAQDHEAQDHEAQDHEAQAQMTNWQNLVWVLISAMVCITALGVTAVFTGHDCQVLTACVSGIVAIVTGLTGYFVGKKSSSSSSGPDQDQDQSAQS